ncbi:tRNA pseudouridine(38-40) synthase TruA [Catellatospora sp. KI3]|uniref:tRNA pseudouridine(38-40) synthase TruA n=1 Tax=Catellatospora sp. KI3 TaxID=3041620 RepID=UPI002482E174|nr:tRNA pseudouridine(38-40) synthase TruA [Catellatospora sp. KI3]MDI1460269.1 tRNA pseudouridine(38-40) synthase TruA [Catellatospora sp. KI3]
MRVRLDVAYDGTDFSGWAVQPERRTVAGVLLAELEKIAGPGNPTGLTVAGRTDAGVHATGQVCHVDLPDERWAALAPTLVRRLAGLLPGDVRVLRAAAVPPEFDARFSALWRRYEYRASDAEAGPSPLRRLDTLFWQRRLDLDRLNAAAAGLCGEHDFAAFCKRKEHATTIRQITAMSWRRDPDGVLVATVQADAFCQAMVRSLVGAMLTVGDGRREPDWPASLLTRTERSSDVLVAPPHGLNLVAVGYPDAAEFAARAEQTRALRGTPAGARPTGPDAED